MAAVGEHEWAFPVGARGRTVFLTAADKLRAAGWMAEGYHRGHAHARIRPSSS